MLNWELINLLRTVIFELLYGNSRPLFARNLKSGDNGLQLNMSVNGELNVKQGKWSNMYRSPKVTQASLYAAGEEKSMTALLFSHLTFPFIVSFPLGKWMTGSLSANKQVAWLLPT